MEETIRLTEEEQQHLDWFVEKFGKGGKKIEISRGKDGTVFVHETQLKRKELLRRKIN